MGSLGFLFGKVGGSMLEVQLNLMEKDGNINILSSPSITTLAKRSPMFPQATWATARSSSKTRSCASR